MKTLILVLVSLTLSACANGVDLTPDSSPVIEVVNYPELPVCNAEFEGYIGRVQSEHKAYKCHNGQWVALD